MREKDGLQCKQAGWLWVTHEEIAEVNPRKPELDDSTHVSFVPMSAVTAETGEASLSEERQFVQVKKGYTSFQDGDILFAKITPCMENGKVALVDKLKNGVGFGSSEFHVSRFHSDLCARFYLYYFLSHPFRKEAQGNMTGSAGQLRVPTSYFREVEVPLPPVNEQRRIVAKIEELFSELDNGVESLKTARAQLQTYRQSLLKAAFEGRLTEKWRKQAISSDALSCVTRTLEQTPEPPKPNRWKTRSGDVIYGHPCLAVGNPKTPLPDHWQWVPLVDIARMESGHTPSRRHPEWWGGDIPWIGIADARQNQGNVIHSTKQHTNEEGLENSAARLLPKGTVCVSRTASVGYVVEMGQPMATSQDFVNWVPTGAVTSAWLRLIFGAHREYLTKFSKGTTHRTIYFPEWMSVHIGLPPIEEQDRIVEEVDGKLSELDAIGETIDSELGRSELLRQSVLKHAFEGKLVSQDPNDEPASALLERIRKEQRDQPTQKRGNRKTGATA